MSDLTQDSLLREIDEDLRRERYLKLWKTYGTWIVAAVVLIVVAVVGVQVWRGWDASRREEASQQFIAATQLAATDRAAAESALQAIADDAPAGYAMLAAFQKAALLNEAGDREAARALYRQLQTSAVDATYRDLAILLDASTAMGQGGVPIDADDIRARLQPLMAETNAWRFTARELAAVLELQIGDVAEARTLLTQLAQDPRAPGDMQERARRVLRQIGDS